MMVVIGYHYDWCRYDSDDDDDDDNGDDDANNGGDDDDDANDDDLDDDDDDLKSNWLRKHYINVGSLVISSSIYIYAMMSIIVLYVLSLYWCTYCINVRTVLMYVLYLST